MTAPVSTVRTRSTSTAGRAIGAAGSRRQPTNQQTSEDPRAKGWVMGDNAHRADLLSGPARSPRTGLDPGTQREGIERSPGSAVAPGELMRLFVAIAPPPAVLDELDALVEPLRARRLDLRWTNREAWHVTLAFLGQVDEVTAVRLLPRLERAAGRHQQVRLAFAGAGAFPAATRANVLWSG